MRGKCLFLVQKIWRLFLFSPKSMVVIFIPPIIKLGGGGGGYTGITVSVCLSACVCSFVQKIFSEQSYLF